MENQEKNQEQKLTQEAFDEKQKELNELKAKYQAFEKQYAKLMRLYANMVDNYLQE